MRRGALSSDQTPAQHPHANANARRKRQPRNVSCFFASSEENTCIARPFRPPHTPPPPLLVGERPDEPLRRNHLRQAVWQIESCCRRRAVEPTRCAVVPLPVAPSQF